MCGALPAPISTSTFTVVVLVHALPEVGVNDLAGRLRRRGTLGDSIEHGFA